METPGNLNRPSSGLSRETLPCVTFSITRRIPNDNVRVGLFSWGNSEGYLSDSYAVLGGELCNTLRCFGRELRRRRRMVFR